MGANNEIRETGTGISGYRCLTTAGRLKIKRKLVQPIARIWYKASRNRCSTRADYRINQHGQQRRRVPDIGGLENYDADNIQHRLQIPGAAAAFIIPRLPV